MSNRIRGEEVTLSLASPTGQVEGMGDVENFEWEMELEVLRQGFLGQPGDQRDEIFRGFKGKADFQLSTADYFRFQQAVQDRAQRRSPAAGKFSVTCSFAFPDGFRVRLTFEDVKFGSLPGRVPQRDAYMSVSINWECETLRRVL